MKFRKIPQRNCWYSKESFQRSHCRIILKTIANALQKFTKHKNTKDWQKKLPKKIQIKCWKTLKRKKNIKKKKKLQMGTQPSCRRNFKRKTPLLRMTLPEFHYPE